MAANEMEQAAPGYHIGAPVVGVDGDEGTVERVILDPETQQVVDLVVLLHGGREVVLPASHVRTSGARGTLVDLDADAVRTLPDFEEIHFRKPDESWPGLPEVTPDVVLFWAPDTAVEAFRPPAVVPEPNVEGVYNVPPGAVTVSADLDVVCGGEVVGHVFDVLTDPGADHATHLVVRREPPEGDERLVPVRAVRRVTEDAVELNCTPGGLDAFPRALRAA